MPGEGGGERIREILCIAVGDREQLVGLAGQCIDIEGLHQGNQSLAGGRIALNDQRVAVCVGEDRTTFRDIRLQHGGELGGGGVMQRQHGGTAERRVRGDAGRGVGLVGRHDAVDAVALHQRGVVLGEQRLQRREHRLVRQRHGGA